MRQSKNFGDLKDHLKELIGKDSISVDDASELPKWKIVEVVKIFGQVRARNFKRNHSLLGDMEKALPPKLYKKLLKIEKNEKVRLAIKIQGMIALRISEVVILKLEDFDFKNHTVMIWEPKTQKWRHVPLYKQLEREIQKYIKKYHEQILNHKNYILFSENLTESRDHLSPNWLRSEIESSIEKTGMQRVYAIDSSGKKRHLYTSHSLRGFGIMEFYKASKGDILLTQKFAGHEKIENTMHYVTHDFKKMFDIVRNS